MKLDLTSFAFGFAINGSNGNPNWATALGQGALYKINQSDSINEIIKGIVYSSISLSLVQAKIGKGGRVYGGTDPDSGIVLGGVFEKVYANGVFVPDCKLVIILTRDKTQSHEGRLRLKYSPHNIALNADGSTAVSNVDQFDKIRNALGLSANACWFVYEMDVVDQDQLHLRVGIADPNANMSYTSTSDLHNKWNDIIVAAGGSPASSPVDDVARQCITYGAPGTGKSYKIDARTNEGNSIRVTFHPDTDYAAFVGAYKPTMSERREQVILDYENLVDKFKEYLSVQPTNVTRACALFGYDYHDSITDVTGHGHTIPELVNDAYKSGSTYDSIVRAGMSVYEQSPSETESISYAFVPQAFMKAYVEAWRRYTDAGLQDDAKTYYLVIEEINRGNCAQIFGDLFQLLDRADNGFSAYAITPDDDIQKFLATDKDYKLADIQLTADITKMTENGPKVIATAADIKTGKKLVLPPNLCIWATMNTSDQSLFPIDSAFKRRWDWKYVPIEDAGKGWKIDVGGVQYKWWSFLEKINEVIATETSSEDKQLGYFFVKANGDVIDANTFVSKVIFYLWGGVFKDNLPEEKAFTYTFKKSGKDDKRTIRFADFYHPEAGSTKEQWRDKLLTSFLDALEVEKESSAAGVPATPGASVTPNESGQGSSTAEGGVAEAGE